MSSDDKTEARLSTIRAFEQLGIPVFPGRLGEKHTWIRGWKSVAAEDALRLASRHVSSKVNMLGRSGDGVAVIDLDGKDGFDPEKVLQTLQDRLASSIIGVVKTPRGYHLWLCCKGSVGNGYCSSIGGEVFSDPHLIVLPPSLHPAGAEYTWVSPPAASEHAVADLQALGLVPDGTTRSELVAGIDKPSEAPDEFVSLMAQAGVTYLTPQQDVRCPWHADEHASLSINWKKRQFKCHATSCGVGGGLPALRVLLEGGGPPTYSQEGVLQPTDYKWGGEERDRERIRLSESLARIGEEAKARNVSVCRQDFRVGRCSNCGIFPAFPEACAHPLCPTCMPARLADDWHARGDLPDEWSLYRLRPTNPVVRSARCVKIIQARFKELRKRLGLADGIAGVRVSRHSGAEILLALPSGTDGMRPNGAFEVELVADCQSRDAALRWLQEEYLEEARGWQSDEELVQLLEAVHGRRRFQPFGGLYRRSRLSVEVAAEPQEAAPATAAPGALKRESQKPAKSWKCPKCGGHVQVLGIVVPQRRVHWREGYWEYDPSGQPGRAA